MRPASDNQKVYAQTVSIGCHRSVKIEGFGVVCIDNVWADKTLHPFSADDAAGVALLSLESMFSRKIHRVGAMRWGRPHGRQGRSFEALKTLYEQPLPGVPYLTLHSALYLLQVFDGHNGPACAKYVKKHLKEQVESHLPPGNDVEAWHTSLPTALAEGFLMCHDTFAKSEGKKWVAGEDKGSE